MSDPSELREALDLVVERFETAYAEPPGIDEVLDAARDYLALLESDAIVIRRDAEGNWPEDTVECWVRSMTRVADVPWAIEVAALSQPKLGRTYLLVPLAALADSSKAPE